MRQRWLRALAHRVGLRCTFEYRHKDVAAPLLLSWTWSDVVVVTFTIPLMYAVLVAHPDVYDPSKISPFPIPMTTLTAPSSELSGYLNAISWETHNLLDRFWDSVSVPLMEPGNIRDSVGSFDDYKFEEPLVQTPEIFFKSGSNPVVNIRSIRRSSAATIGNDELLSDNVWQPFGKQMTPPPPPPVNRNFDIEHPRTYHSPQITFQPASPSYSVHQGKNIVGKPKIAIPSRRHHKDTGIGSPGSALLALASNFLSTMVNLGISQPSTPSPRQQEDDLCIFHSEVLISVVDEAFRGRQGPSAGYRDFDGIEWLESAPASSIYSPMPSIRGLGSAEEMDALAKMTWERQLMRAQGR